MVEIRSVGESKRCGCRKVLELGCGDKRVGLDEHKNAVNFVMRVRKMGSKNYPRLLAD